MFDAFRFALTSLPTVEGTVGLNYLHIDERTRRFMLLELEDDIASGKLYISPRLSSGAIAQYPDLLRKAFATHTDDWLAAQLDQPGIFVSHETRTRNGNTFQARVPVNAGETLAEGEFNRFYMRGLCQVSREDGNHIVVVYRAKDVATPRPKSVALIGQEFHVETLLLDLQTSQYCDAALGLPPGPNSGLSVRFR